MAYVAPSARTTGEFITAAIWNQDVKDNVLFLANPPACRVNNSVVQSISHDTLTALAFNSEVYDTDTMHDTVTNNTRVTFTTAGLYRIVGLVSAVAGTDYTRFIWTIRKNGTTLLHQEIDSNPGTLSTLRQYGIATEDKFAAADYVELMMQQENGAAAARNTDVTSVRPYLAAVWVGFG